MTTIIKKGTNDSAFLLANGKKILLKVGAGEGDFFNVIPDADYNQLMKEYGSFITPRIISDKNPQGCFIIFENRQKALDMGREIGDEIKDNSAPVEVNRFKRRKGRK